MQEQRDMKVSSLLEVLEKKADHIMNEFADFTSGCRVLLLLQRTKDGGHNKEHKRRKARYVVHNPEQFRNALFQLLLAQFTSEKEYRIYLASAPRDVRKAEQEFKRLMLEVDFQEGENKEFFYEHIEDKWISALMSSNPIKDTGVFILDVDDKDGEDMYGYALKECAELNIEIIKSYRTKNGWHIVVKPFNRTLFPKSIGEVKDDGLLLLSYL